MKCHYDVLGINRDACEDEIKKSYRKLALQWHPDKNPDNVEEAKLQFQLVQQAYEVLSDSNERAWYDKHRESILRGGLGSNYDNSLDIFQFFTSSCFSGYNDDEKGFYSVYREVFNTIAAEESTFDSGSDSEFEVPNFGNSNSSYDDVVHPFYRFWHGYSTKKSFAWLNIYDIKEAPNRKVVKIMEKENKKIRDKARKERNEEVRNLVAFVKKRDKRVQAHAVYMQEKKDNNKKKSEQLRQNQLKEKKEELASYQESEWSKFSNLEQELKNIESNLANQFGDVSDTEEEYVSDTTMEKPHSLYCVACNKLFKTMKAFENHENSKKHKENIAHLKLDVEIEDALKSDSNNVSEESLSITNKIEEFSSCNVNNTIDIHTSSISEIDDKIVKKKTKKDKKKKNIAASQSLVLSDDSLSDTSSFQDIFQGKRQKKKILLQKSILESKKLVRRNEESLSCKEDNLNLLIKGDEKLENSTLTNSMEQSDYSVGENSSKPITEQCLNRKVRNVKTSEESGNKIKGETTIRCVTCKCPFISKNKLFDHLKKSGHAVQVSSVKCQDSDPIKLKKYSKRPKNSN